MYILYTLYIFISGQKLQQVKTHGSIGRAIGQVFTHGKEDPLQLSVSSQLGQSLKRNMTDKQEHKNLWNRF